jgi:hypothetical protein
MPKRRFHVVKTNDPAAVFDDIDALREIQTAAPAAPTFQRQRQKRNTEYFVRIPIERARPLKHLSGTAWWLWIELEWLVFKSHGRNPVKLTSHSTPGLSRFAKARALQQLVRAGVIFIEQKPGCAPLVTLRWHPIQQTGDV